MVGERRGVSPPWIAMTFLRRLIAWVLYLGFLTAVGICVFTFVRYRPRCIITGPPIFTSALSADGSRLMILKHSKTDRPGPLKLWDTQSGQIVREMPGNGVEVWCYPSPDGCLVARYTDDGVLRLIDWHTGHESVVPVPNEIDDCCLSAKGRWLVVYTKAPASSIFIDMDTRRISFKLDERHVQVSHDERWGFVRDWQNKQIDVWNLSTAKKVTTIAANGEMVAAPDGGSVVTWLVDHKAIAFPHNGLEIWDLPTGRKRCRLEFPANARGLAEFSSNSRFLATWLHGEKTCNLELLDVDNGQRLLEVTVTPGSGGEFSPDSAHYFLWQNDKGRTFTMYDVATGRKLWERHTSLITRFAGDSGNLLLQDHGNTPLLVLDARTGEAKPTGPQNFRTAHSLPFPTPDGRHFVIDGWQLRNREPYFWETWLDKRWPELFGDDAKVTIILESATGRELFRIRRVCMNSMLATDASTLVTLDDTNADETLIRIWDVHPRRAWTWALSSIAVTVILWLAVSRSLRALRKRKVAAADTTEQVMHPIPDRPTL